MEIRHKLTIQFTVLVALLLLAILSFNYYLAYRFAQESFFVRLEEKAMAVGNYHQAETEKKQPKNDPNSILQLHDESILVYDASGDLVFLYGKSKWRPTADLARKLKASNRELRIEGNRHILGRMLTFEGEKLYIFASAVDKVGKSKLRNLASSMVVSFLIFLVFVVLTGYFLSKKALEPIQSVISQVRLITAKNLNNRVIHENEKDEIAQLSHTFNLMLERLENSFKTQADFVRNSSHELRNPLASMIGQAEIALNRERDSLYYREVIQTMYQESLRLKHIVNNLLHLSKASPETVTKSNEKIRLDELIFDVIENLMIMNPAIQIDVNLLNKPEKEPLFKGNRGLLEIALGNLLENACKYSGNAPVKCSLDFVDSHLRLVIQDSGIGMTHEEILQISEPFFRSERVRSKEGHGIGMTVAAKVFQVHGIKMEITSRPGIGTNIELLFPEEISPLLQEQGG